MKPMPMVLVSDMQAAIRFYKRLGLEVRFESRNGMWTELVAGDSMLALHRVDPSRIPPAQVKLNFLSDQPLRQVERRLRRAGVEIARGVADEAFGWSLVIRDPDGMPIQLDQHERD